MVVFGKFEMVACTYWLLPDVTGSKPAVTVGGGACVATAGPATVKVPEGPAAVTVTLNVVPAARPPMSPPVQAIPVTAPLSATLHEVPGMERVSENATRTELVPSEAVLIPAGRAVVPLVALAVAAGPDFVPFDATILTVIAAS